MSGKLFVISSPSGGGKSTIISALMREDKNLVYSISMTTRSPRTNERDTIEYFFVDLNTFKSHIEAGDFLEWAEVHDHYYGTLKSQVDQQINQGKKVILDIDVQGANKVKGNMPESVRIFILPPSLDILRQRLRNRGTETAESLENRLQIAEKEIAQATEYDYMVINNNLDTAIKSVKEILNK